MTSPLAAFPAFASFEAHALTELEGYLTRETVAPGTTLIREGDADAESRSLYFVLEGRCVVLRSRGAGEPLRFPVEAGEMFGAIALVDARPRSASVVADGPVEVLRLSAERFEAIRASGSSLAFALELAIARQMARDFAGMNERLAADTEERAYPAGDGPDWETMTSYSGLSSMRGEMTCPHSIAGITDALASAQRLGRRVTLRGHGLSFDTQAMGNEVVLSLRRFDSIEVDPEARTVTVGAGATWGAIVAATIPHGLMPAVVISGSDVTAAGTVSSNALSRFSVIYGKEGKWVREVELLLPGGESVRASRREHPDLFHAVVGGFGLVGILVRVTYDLLPVGTPVRVRSDLERVPEVEGLAPSLQAATSADPHAPTAYAFVAIRGDALRSVVTRSRYVNDEPLRTLLPHRRASVARLPVELAIHNVAGAGQRFWNFAYDSYVDETRPYVDELEGYTFFMDGNLRVHQSARRLGVPFRTIQQTYVVPSGGGDDRLGPFLRLAQDLIRRDALDLALMDVLHLPEDEPFALSSTRGLAGYAVTLTFEGVHDVPTIGRLRGRLVELSQEVRRLGGRVHLTKNVFATRDDLEAMYGEGLRALAAVKARVDPNGILANDFADRLFPRLRR